MALLAPPLLAGNDLTMMAPKTLALLTNKDLGLLPLMYNVEVPEHGVLRLRLAR